MFPFAGLVDRVGHCEILIGLSYLQLPFFNLFGFINLSFLQVERNEPEPITKEKPSSYPAFHYWVSVVPYRTTTIQRYNIYFQYASVFEKKTLFFYFIFCIFTDMKLSIELDLPFSGTDIHLIVKETVEGMIVDRDILDAFLSYYAIYMMHTPEAKRLIDIIEKINSFGRVSDN